MSKLSIAYFGTPYFSAVFLEKLLSDKTLPVEVKLVITQPDKPVGRKQVITKSPVKIVAEKYGLEVIDSKVQDLKSKVSQLDLAFLFAYGNIIPNDLLSAPKYGFLNTHPSLLPLYRGPGPIAYPMILGDKKTGITLIQLDQEIDHGPIIAQEELDINPSDKRSDLELKLTDLAFEIFKKLMTGFDEKAKISILNDLRGTQLERSEDEHAHRVKNAVSSFLLKNQKHSLATFTRQMTKNDGFIPLSILKAALNNEPNNKWQPKIISDYFKKNSILNPQSSKLNSPSSTIYRLFNGLYPWPGIWTQIQPKRLDVEDHNSPKRLKITDLDLINDKLIIKKVQLEGKKEVDFETFNRAYSIF